METTQPIQVRAVVYEADGVWVAQCLEHDIAAFARSLPDLPRAFVRTVGANLAINASLGRAGLDGIGPAPMRFVAMYDGSELDLAQRGEKAASPVVSARLRVSESA